MKRMQYYECPYCGSHLDYGEKCDCRTQKEQTEDYFAQRIRISPKTGQMSFCWGGKEGLYAEKNAG